MSVSFDILAGGAAASDFSSALSTLEVEENVDMPGAFTLTLPVSRISEGDLDRPSDPRIAPLANIAVIAKAGDGPTHCLFDGFVLAQSLHLDTGTTSSTVKVWGQDASWLMNTTERAREWVDITDATVANTIFGEYGFTPDPSNTDEDSPSHTQSGHSLMQRATDAQFLRMLARRNGKLSRVFCTDTAGQRTGWFARPKLDGDPAAVLTLNDANAATVEALEISWDVMRPSAVSAQQALFTSTEPASGDTSDSGLSPLEARDLASFASQPVTALLTTTVDDGGELTARAQAVLREAGWFVRCQGTADAGRLGAILRAGTVVRLDAAGAVHSGKYLVWSVRHSISAEAHKMDFTLLRNAVGAPGSGASGPLGGLGL